MRYGFRVFLLCAIAIFFAAEAFAVTLTVSVSGMDGFDRVVSDPSGIDCLAASGACSADFGTGASVALAAIPVSGPTWTSSFLNWTGNCSGGSEACVLVMSGNRSVTANFGALGIPIGLVDLTVTLNGDGTVVSNPEGLSCVGNTCTGTFTSNTAVALQAIPDTPPEGFSAFFVDWSGDCTGSGPCPLYMDSTKNVTAQFGILGPPAFAIPAPVGQSTFRYNPVAEPVITLPAADNRPFAIGNDPDAVDLWVELPFYSDAVDVYVGIEVPGWPDLLLLGPGSATFFLADGLVAWKEDVLFGSIDESLFGPIDISMIPDGLYRLYVMVTPAGSLASYHLWTTYFDTTSPTNAFLP